MKKKMLWITAFLLLGFAIALPVFIVTKNGTIEALTITLGVSLYHFLMRLAVGYTVNAVMKNQADHTNIWFREKRFEKKLYKLLRVRSWSRHLPTYSPNTFDTGTKTVKEILGATCQAEIVHEIIMALSLLPIAFIPLLGGAAALIVTSVLAMLFDALFVILQRYNRPKLLRVMNRFQKLKSAGAER